jgi:hypothetical protein
MEVRPMLIKYLGPSEEVSLAPDAGGITFRRGQSVDVPDDLARSLLEQSTFAKAGKPPAKGRGSAKRSHDQVETR